MKFKAYGVPKICPILLFTLHSQIINTKLFLTLSSSFFLKFKRKSNLGLQALLPIKIHSSSTKVYGFHPCISFTHGDPKHFLLHTLIPSMPFFMGFHIIILNAYISNLLILTSLYYYEVIFNFMGKDVMS